MKKLVLISLTLALLISVFAGCATQTASPANSQPAATTAATSKPDTTSGASLASDENKLVTALSKDGNWIILFKADMTTTKELVIEGDMAKPGTTPAPGSTSIPQARKIALYDQDASKNKTATYTLTAPKLTVKATSVKLQGGVFKGDIYVENTGFNLVDQKVDGNIYFKTQAMMDSFKKDAKSSVTGKTEVKQ